MKTLLSTLILLTSVVSPVFSKVEDFIGKSYLCSFETYSLNFLNDNVEKPAFDKSPFGFTVTKNKIEFSKKGFFNGDAIDIVDRDYKFDDMLMGTNRSYYFQLRLDKAHVFMIESTGSNYSFIADCEEL